MALGESAANHLGVFPGSERSGGGNDGAEPRGSGA